MIRFLLRQSPKLMVLAAVAGVVSGGASTGLLALINTLIGRQERDDPLLVGAFVALCLLVPVSRIASELLLIHLGQETVYKLRLDLSERVLAVPLRRLEEIGPPRVLSTLAEDVPTITGTVGQLPLMFINGSILAGGLVYLGILSWRVLLGVLVMIVVGVLSYQLPVIRANRYFRRARYLNDDLYGHFESLTGGAKELKLHAARRRDFLDRDLRGTAAAHRDQTVAGRRIYTVAASWGQLLVFVVIGGVLLLPTEVTGGAETLTGYALTLLYLMTPLQMLMNAVPGLHRAHVAYERIHHIGLELEESASEPVAAEALEGFDGWRRLVLDGVRHEYRTDGQEHPFVLGPVDLEIRRGEILFLAGGNGSGKTTLAKLITGLYAPDAGALRLDDRVIDDANRESYRQLFSVVFFDFELFHNFPGLTGETLDRLAAGYLERLELAEKVRVEEGRLTTTELSQGQRKRLALLTAWLEDRPIYLFDEWAAEQDPQFKQLFYRTLLPQLQERGKTCIVISHDDRFYDAADRLVKLEEGQIVDSVEDPMSRVGLETQPVAQRR